MIYRTDLGFRDYGRIRGYNRLAEGDVVEAHVTH